MEIKSAKKLVKDERQVVNQALSQARKELTAAKEQAKAAQAIYNKLMKSQATTSSRTQLQSVVIAARLHTELQQRAFDKLASQLDEVKATESTLN